MNNQTREEMKKRLEYSIRMRNQPRMKRWLRHPLFSLKSAALHRIFRYIMTGRVLKPRVKMFWGEKMYITLPPWFEFLMYGAYSNGPELRLTKFLINHLEDNTIFFDLGANLGYYSLLASNISKNLRVFSFEPNEEIREVLEKNKRDNIQIVPEAVSNIAGHAELHYGNIVLSGVSTLNLENTMLTEWGGKLPKRTIVKTTTLDLFCHEWSIKPDVVKIDVEGAEADVLMGAKTLLEKKGLVIIMEVWIRPFTENYRRAIEILKKANFLCYGISEDGTLERVVYPKLKDYFSKIKRTCRTQSKRESIVDNLVFIHKA